MTLGQSLCPAGGIEVRRRPNDCWRRSLAQQSEIGDFCRFARACSFSQQRDCSEASAPRPIGGTFRTLKRFYPDIVVEEDVLYVALVRRDFGSRVANSVARRLVMPPHRDGGQAQYVAAPVQERPGRTIGEVMDWARKRLDQPLQIGMLADHAAMSERTFQRRFEESVGMPPIAWLQRERMFRARELLEESKRPLPEIAERCGYQSVETFRAAFKRVVGTSPAAYRKRFKRSS
jgi:AraC family transcriptional regulator, transcriptional activator FtrA